MFILCFRQNVELSYLDCLFDWVKLGHSLACLKFVPFLQLLFMLVFLCSNHMLILILSSD